MTREPIYAGLFGLMAALPGVVTASRSLRHWADVPAEQQPALFMAQQSEQPQTRTGQPPAWTLSVDIYVYCRAVAGLPPAAVLNPILDAIEGAFVLHPITGKHTLPGIDGVEWARIDGAIETDEGTLGDQTVAIIPIRILAT